MNTTTNPFIAAQCDQACEVIALEVIAQPVLAPAPGYCKNCKDYTIEEPLIAQPVPPADRLTGYMTRNYPDAKGSDLSERVIDALQKMDIALGMRSIAQPVQPDLNALVQKVHKAKGRYHTQIAMCDLYGACALSNFRPGIEPDHDDLETW